MAEWLGFNGPLKGSGSVEDIVSHLPAVRAELKSAGHALAARARSNLSLHKDNGHAKVMIVSPPKTKLDWHVAIVDATPPDSAGDRTDNENKSAISIEMGHWVKTKTGRKWVEGIHALGNAVEDRVRKHGGK